MRAQLSQFVCYMYIILIEDTLFIYASLNVVLNLVPSSHLKDA